MSGPLKIIQFASICSNLGDNANIRGLRWLIRTTFPEREIVFTDWDIVDYSWTRVYTEADIDFVNTHDLLIIGGGGFFEILPNTPSWTGTRFNIPEALFRKIKIPILFHGIGTHRVRADLAGSDVGPQIDRFGRFLDELMTRDDVLLAFRNDGSREVLRRTLGDAVADRVTVVADAGLYTQIPKTSPWPGLPHPDSLRGRPLIALNFGGDLLEARFPSDAPGYQHAGAGRWSHPGDYEKPKVVDHAGFMRFVGGISDVLRAWLDAHPEMTAVFVPHIYRDVQMGAALLTELGFPYNRRRVTMAPYLHGFDGHDYIMDLYQRCDCVIGMRFHANVSPVGLGVPTIGLATFPMLRGFYDEIGCPDRTVDPNSPNAMTHLHDLLTETVCDGDAIRNRYRSIRKDCEKTSRHFVARIADLVRM
ncbi:polysaccharide pyruvyl transferase family protein [Azospirillum doebereinerae]